MAILPRASLAYFHILMRSHSMMYICGCNLSVWFNGTLKGFYYKNHFIFNITEKGETINSVSRIAIYSSCGLRF